jgi:hypothetical protein
VVSREGRCSRALRGSAVEAGSFSCRHCCSPLVARHPTCQAPSTSCWRRGRRSCQNSQASPQTTTNSRKAICPPTRGSIRASSTLHSIRRRSSSGALLCNNSPLRRPFHRPANPQAAQPPPPNIPRVYWKPSFDAATPVAQNFGHELGDHGWGNEEKQMYTDNTANSFHHDSRLVVRALVQNGSYTSARLTSHQTLSRPRGYLSATCLPPSAPGIWPAYWMLPADPFKWPTDGEVDLAESWNGEPENHSCLHWGSYTGEDAQKHRVVKTRLPDLARQPHTYGFAWIEEEGIPAWRGRMVWYIDGRPVMKASIPQGTRRMEDFRILINIAMGGTVNQHRLPRDGYYDFVISDLYMCEEPPLGGWQGFEHAWHSTPEGTAM